MADRRDVRDATFACPDLTTFTRLDELGLEVIGQRLEPDCAVFAGWCRRRVSPKTGTKGSSTAFARCLPLAWRCWPGGQWAIPASWPGEPQ